MFQKVSVKDLSNTVAIPPIGWFWKLKGSGVIYQRIADYYGEKALNVTANNTLTFFYNVVATAPEGNGVGNICQCSKGNVNIVVLDSLEITVK
jgi:hypothetical protein